MVVDASVLVAALVGVGDDGQWAEAIVAAGDLVAPHVMPAEVTNVLRRGAASGAISDDAASLARGDLDDLLVTLHPFKPLADRVWEMCDNLTPYDAWYVALAEALDAPLATLDMRLAAAPGTRCELLTP